eukprot:gene11850-biopygen22922
MKKKYPYTLYCRAARRTARCAAQPQRRAARRTQFVTSKNWEQKNQTRAGRGPDAGGTMKFEGRTREELLRCRSTRRSRGTS